MNRGYDIVYKVDDLKKMENYDYMMLESSYYYNMAMNKINSFLKVNFLEIEDLIIPYFYLDKIQLKERSGWVNDILEYTVGEIGRKEVVQQIKNKEGLLLFNFPLNLDDKKVNNIINNIFCNLPLKYQFSVIAFVTEAILDEEFFIKSVQKPYAYYDVNENSFEKFLSRLKKEERKKINYDIKKLNQLKIDTKEIEISNYEEAIKNICLKNKYFFDWNYISEILKIKDVKTIGYFKDFELYQLNSFLKSGNSLYNLLIIIDEEKKELGTLFHSYINPIEYCIKNSIRRFYLGYSAIDAKKFRGAKYIERTVYIKKI
ncbi:hypothetical protein [Cetobacterium sp.]